MKSLGILKLFAATFVVFLVLDFIWLSFVAEAFYQAQIGYLLKAQPGIFAALLFYLLYILGVLYFVVLPSLKARRLPVRKVALAGGVFGLVMYGAYDLTNLATIAGWPVKLVIVDMLWGAVLTALVSVISYAIGKKL